MLMGIGREKKEIEGWLSAWGSLEKVSTALNANQTFWRERLDAIRVQTDDKDFDRWLRWVTLQPFLRKIFGNSFLPDFDYGRGGRGWRDLWQDGLGLAPACTARRATRDLLVNNFSGIRMNGTNATIIGKKKGEFIADRNNISRVWMDHGVWPWITSEFYLHQTGDLDLLLTEVPYFWDQDKALAPAAERGTILEHLLAQHLTAYLNIGEHGNCRLEDADWNDGLDMAHTRGESVAFTAVFAGNLLKLSRAVGLLGERKALNLRAVSLAEEIEQLLEKSGSTTGLSPAQKQERLKGLSDARA